VRRGWSSFAVLDFFTGEEGRGCRRQAAADPWARQLPPLLLSYQLAAEAEASASASASVSLILMLGAVELLGDFCEDAGTCTGAGRQ